MISWIQAHAFLLLQVLAVAIVAIPIVANLSIYLLRRYFPAGGKASKVAAWIAAKAPLIVADLVFVRDVIVHPEQLLRIQGATEIVKAKANATPDDAELAVASARLSAAVEGKPVSVKAPPGLALLLLVPLLSGCGGASLDKIKAGVQDVTQAISMMDPLLRATYEAEQEKCLKADQDQDACIAQVRSTWRPIIDRLLQIRAKWCELQPSAEGCAS